MQQEEVLGFQVEFSVQQFGGEEAKIDDDSCLFPIEDMVKLRSV